MTNFKTLEGMTKLAESVAVYVPTTNGTSAEATQGEISTMLQYVKKAMASDFGGFTVTEGQGGYVAENGELVEERVFIVRSNVEEVTERDVLIAASIAKTVKRAMNQECVSLEVNSELYFV